MRWVGTHQSHIQLAVIQRLELLAGHHLLQRQRDVGHPFVELADHPWQQAVAECRSKANRNRSVLALRYAPRRRGCLFRQTEDPRGFRKEHLAGSGKAHHPVRSFE